MWPLAVLLLILSVPRISLGAFGKQFLLGLVG